MPIKYEYSLKSYKHTIFDNPDNLWRNKAVNHKLLVIDLMNARHSKVIIHNDNCCICLETIKKLDFSCINCKNNFHKYCVRNCQKCPLCRKNYGY